MATQFTRFKRYGLLNVEHFGGRSMLEVPLVDRCVEEEFGEGMEFNSTRSHWSSGGRLPGAFEEVYRGRRWPF
uniref:Uncharacterized protein n=1 Tax=Acrobeloides nanus TaxID=290746 RepID=A0A914CZQ1_9BILA